MAGGGGGAAEVRSGDQAMEVCENVLDWATTPRHTTSTSAAPLQPKRLFFNESWTSSPLMHAALNGCGKGRHFLPDGESTLAFVGDSALIWAPPPLPQHAYNPLHSVSNINRTQQILVDHINAAASPQRSPCVASFLKHCHGGGDFCPSKAHFYRFAANQAQMFSVRKLLAHENDQQHGTLERVAIYVTGSSRVVSVWNKQRSEPGRVDFQFSLLHHTVVLLESSRLHSDFIVTIEPAPIRNVGGEVLLLAEYGCNND